MLVILGAGESGIGAALLAKKIGINCFVSDSGEIKDNYRKELTDNNIDFEEKGHTEQIILSAREIVKSPGIPDTAPIIQKAKAKNIPIISEIEFASRYTNGTFIAITGSNGKTTTTTLIYEILKSAGYDVALTGNVGMSLARSIAQREYKYYVLELSSFQLDGCYKFNPHIALLLNITPDHLDRYDYNFQNYINSKMRIVQNHRPQDFFIFWKQDKNITSYLTQNPVPSQLMVYTLEQDKQAQAYFSNGEIIITHAEQKFVINASELSLRGKHNILNSMAAALAALIVNVDKKYINSTLRTFKGVEHRLEKVDTINGVNFINDSKATNVNSVWYALEAMEQPTILILGGIDKGNDYSQLTGLVKEKVKAIVAMGKDNSKIIKAFNDIVQVYNTDSMNEAITTAYSLARQGDTILLSPACASFDLFDNYVDRGNKFKQAVYNLKLQSQ